MNKTYTYLLENGLRIIGEPISWAQGAAVGFIVNTGSRDEESIESGVSHFLEHMLFKGTEKRDYAKLNYDLGAIGAKANAFTSDEITVYYAAIVGKYVSPLLEILSDMLKPSLLAEEFNMEKKVILEEIALYEDRPLFWLFEKSSRHFFEDHPAGNSVLGSVESITNLTRDQMVQYFDRRYAPSNMVLVATGNIDWDKFCKEAEQLCSHWAPQPVTREAIPFRRSIMQEQVIYKRPNLQQGHILFLTPGCAYLDDAKYSLGILASIVGDSMGSRLYWELVDSGIAEYAGAENECKDGVGSFGVFASTRPTDIDKVRDIILKVLSSLTDFSDEDLERAKNKTLAHLILSGESAMGRMLALGRYWVNTQKLHSIEETIKKVSDVTRETINDALKKYPLDKWCEYQLLPE